MNQPIVIVVDTNVFVSAVLGKGASREVLRNCLAGHYLPIMGNTLFIEYESLLTRDTLFANCYLTVLERETLLDAFLSICRWTNIYYHFRPNLKDEADNHLIELAIAGGAKYLVTKNRKDFLTADLRFPQLQIVLPETLLQRRP
jgi:putative PIN family toxin of toxin-antitoxin system